MHEDVLVHNLFFNFQYIIGGWSDNSSIAIFSSGNHEYEDNMEETDFREICPDIMVLNRIKVGYRKLNNYEK